jgi:hypothetical protein
MTIYDNFHFLAKVVDLDGKEHEVEGVHDGEEDSWYGHIGTNKSGEEVAFNLNIYGGKSYGDGGIHFGAYKCTTRNSASKTGWCADRQIEIDVKQHQISLRR